jgi:hypothetical protein
MPTGTSVFVCGPKGSCAVKFELLLPAETYIPTFHQSKKKTSKRPFPWAMVFATVFGLTVLTPLAPAQTFSVSVVVAWCLRSNSEGI